MNQDDRLLTSWGEVAEFSAIVINNRLLGSVPAAEEKDTGEFIVIQNWLKASGEL